MNMSMNEINSDSSEHMYVHLSNGLIQSFEIRKHLEYEYIQFTVDLFCENVALVHCSMHGGLQLRFTIFPCISKSVL